MNDSALIHSICVESVASSDGLISFGADNKLYQCVCRGHNNVMHREEGNVCRTGEKNLQLCFLCVSLWVCCFSSLCHFIDFSLNNEISTQTRGKVSFSKLSHMTEGNPFICMGGATAALLLCRTEGECR